MEWQNNLLQKEMDYINTENIMAKKKKKKCCGKVKKNASKRCSKCPKG